MVLLVGTYYSCAEFESEHNYVTNFLVGNYQVNYSFTTRGSPAVSHILSLSHKAVNLGSVHCKEHYGNTACFKKNQE